MVQKVRKSNFLLLLGEGARRADEVIFLLNLLSPDSQKK